jgi:hypothetical protein
LNRVPGRIPTLFIAAVVVLGAVGVGCAQTPPPAPTRLLVTTQLTVCGGVIPPPGQPWCRTSTVRRDVEVRSGRDVVATGSTDASGRLLVVVPPGRATVAVTDANDYEQCDTVTVTAIENATTPVVQTCTIFAP